MSIRYPFIPDMKIGDSFLLTKEDQLFPSNVGNALSEWTRAKRRWRVTSSEGGKGWRFTIRRTDKGYRCWRIE